MSHTYNAGLLIVISQWSNEVHFYREFHLFFHVYVLMMKGKPGNFFKKSINSISHESCVLNNKKQGHHQRKKSHHFPLQQTFLCFNYFLCCGFISIFWKISRNLSLIHMSQWCNKKSFNPHYITYCTKYLHIKHQTNQLLIR
jgi:hypothetical protein